MSQPLPVTGQASVTDALIEMLRARQEKGIETYGRSLETFNGRDSVQDALEEAIDLSQYLLQVKLERAAIFDATMEAWRILDDLAVRQKTTPPELYQAQDVLGSVLTKAKASGWTPKERTYEAHG